MMPRPARIASSGGGFNADVEEYAEACQARIYWDGLPDRLRAAQGCSWWTWVRSRKEYQQALYEALSELRAYRNRYESPVMPEDPGMVIKRQFGEIE